MGTVTLGKENFEETVRSNEMVLVDLWASWRGPRRMFAPVPGALPARALEDLIGQLEARDIDEVRAQQAAGDTGRA